MNNAQYLCSETLELSGQVRELCLELNTLLQSAGGTDMFEDEGPVGPGDIENMTEGMSAGEMLQWNLSSVILLEGLKTQLLRMILKLRGVE